MRTSCTVGGKTQFGGDLEEGGLVGGAMWDGTEGGKWVWVLIGLCNVGGEWACKEGLDVGSGR